MIEGSNTNKNGDWKILDTRNNVKELDDRCAEVTFKISAELSQNEAFRYLRLRQTDLNTRDSEILFISALEFFGTLINN